MINHSDALLALLFGLCTIATLFVFIGWMKVLCSPQPMDRKYYLVALGTMTANIGVMLLCANRTSAHMGWPQFLPFMLLVPAIIILTGKALWIYGAAPQDDPKLVYGFGAAALCWVIFCAVRFL